MKCFVVALAVAGSLALASAAQAVTFDLVPFTGDPVKVQIEATASAGVITVDAMVVQTGGYVNTGDIIALYFDVSNESLLGSLIIQGAEVTAVAQSANNVGSVGSPSTNLNGGGAGNPGKFDVGVAIGSNGLGGGSDDFPSTTFTISHAGLFLDLDFLENEKWGARVQSVGLPGSGRNGSSKLSGYFLEEPDGPGEPTDEPVPTAVPEPASAMLGMMGLISLGGLAMRRRREA